ncbi:hypothetical protein [Tsukamurella strandjordii]|uniref:hypothetical protein n=1 Tax=Tsukamurella strandjordii TaxID=147577 RepID=UPI0031CF9886
MIHGFPAKRPGTCLLGCASPAIAPGDLIGYWKDQLMHAACVNHCNGTLREYADNEARLDRRRDRQRAEISRHRALLKAGA